MDRRLRFYFTHTFSITTLHFIMVKFKSFSFNNALILRPMRERGNVNRWWKKLNLSHMKVLIRSKVTEVQLTDHTVHICLRPDDIMVMVDHHRPAQNVEVLHHIFLHVCQCRHVCVVPWMINTHQHNLQKIMVSTCFVLNVTCKNKKKNTKLQQIFLMFVFQDKVITVWNKLLHETM